MYCFEDFAVDRVFDLGQCTVSEEEIVAFGTCYDSQPFHVDGVAAADSIYGGLIASGVHTTALYMRLFVDGLLSDSASLGSPGIDELRWPTPVHPGDTLRARYTVASSRSPAATQNGGSCRVSRSARTRMVSA
jgi:acyl dehydratase